MLLSGIFYLRVQWEGEKLLKYGTFARKDQDGGRAGARESRESSAPEKHATRGLVLREWGGCFAGRRRTSASCCGWKALKREDRKSGMSWGLLFWECFHGGDAGKRQKSCFPASQGKGVGGSFGRTEKRDGNRLFLKRGEGGGVQETVWKGIPSSPIPSVM